MPRPITALLFGAGARGAGAYGLFALEHKNEIRFVAVAEPDSVRREKFAAAHAIPEELCFESWETALEGGKLADVVINCTQDQTHHASGIAALKAGYDMLLEKPIAPVLDQAVELVKTAEEWGRYLQICHVLRYTKFFRTVHEMVNSGRLGQTITFSHRENVASWHMAHSFVRGNWRKAEESAPMILAKSCHDLDLINWIIGERVTKVSSFGSLTHFRPEYAPEGVPDRCTDGCPVEETCPFYAPAVYIDLHPIKVGLSRARNPLLRITGKLSLRWPALIEFLSFFIPILKELTRFSRWPRIAVSDDPANVDSLMEALRAGPYGVCVYKCDNDVVDHQVVSMEFESGVTGTFTMQGHSHEEGRTFRIDGSKASMLAKFSMNASFIEIHDHRSLGVERINFPNNIEDPGHGGGDDGVMQDFISAIRGKPNPASSARNAVESHLLAFAADEARENGVVVDMRVFREKWEM